MHKIYSYESLFVWKIALFTWKDESSTVAREVRPLFSVEGRGTAHSRSKVIVQVLFTNDAWMEYEMDERTGTELVLFFMVQKEPSQK